MQPVFSVEFRARNGGFEFEEESVTLRDPEQLLAFIAPGGGCEKIPDTVDEIHLALIPPAATETSALHTLPTSVQVGMVFISGPLGEVVDTLAQIRQRASEGRLSRAFLTVIGAGH